MNIENDWTSVFHTEQAMFSSIMKKQYKLIPKRIKRKSRPFEKEDERIFTIQYPSKNRSNKVQLISTRKTENYNSVDENGEEVTKSFYEDLQCEYVFNNVKISFCGISDPSDCRIVYSALGENGEEILASVFESGKAEFNQYCLPIEFQDAKRKIENGQKVFLMDIIKKSIERNPNLSANSEDIINNFNTIISLYPFNNLNRKTVVYDNEKFDSFLKSISDTKFKIENANITENIKEHFLSVIGEMEKYIESGVQEESLIQFIEELAEMQRFIKTHDKKVDNDFPEK